MAWTGGPERRLVLVSGYPPNTAFGGGLILRALLATYPADRLTVVTSQGVLATLAERADGGGLLPARHVGIRAWTSRRAGLRRAARWLNGLNVLTAARIYLATALDLCNQEKR